MITATQILKKARTYINTKDDGNNKVIFNTEFYGRAVSGDAYPWCVVFVWYLFKMLGASKLFCNGKKIASCGVVMAEMAAQKLNYKSTPKKGDLVIFDFSGKHTAHTHIGIVSEVLNSTEFKTIEGNTSSTNYTNGGYVLEQKRNINQVNCFIRPAYSAETNTVKFKKDGALYNKAWKDPVGGASKPAVKLKKGAKVEWVSDDKYGWSKVKYNGKTYWCLNSRLDKSGLSACPTKTLTKNITASKVVDNKVTETKTIKKGEKIRIICEIESGKYKGYSFIKRLSTEKNFYAKL